MEKMLVDSGRLEVPFGSSSKDSTSRKGKTHSVISFFSGCGGLDLGFIGGFDYKGERMKSLPFEIRAAYDHDEKCVVTYQQNIGLHARTRDLSNMDVSDMPEAELLIGGFPCQDFSSCGPKAGLSSKRGRLYQALITY